MIAVAAPRRVRARLAAASGRAVVLHRGPVAVYLDVDGRCVGVVGTAAAAVPCALRLATPGVGELADASAAHVADGLLHLDGVPLVVGRAIDVGVPRLSTWPVTGWPTAWPDADLSDVAREVPVAALDRLAVGDPAAVADLIGRGSGLTPAGDDVLCGWLAIHHAAGVGVLEMERAVSASLSRTTTLSATLLECALHGEVLPEFAGLVRALGHPELAPAAARDLARIGHTSGRALLLGAGLAGHHLRSLGSEWSRCA